MSNEVYTWGDYCKDKGILYTATIKLLDSTDMQKRVKDSPYYGGKYDYMTEYGERYSTIFRAIDLAMYNKYKDILLPAESDLVGGTKSSFIDWLIRSFWDVNDYKLQTLYNSMFFEYNPIWNVDGTETTTTIHGATSSADSYGAKTDTDINGKRESSNDSKSYRYPYDSGTKTATDELEESATTESSTDTHTSSEHSDTHTTESYTDTVTNERAGNIGVTSTQSLIDQERSVAMFSFYERLFEELIDYLAIPKFNDTESEECIYDSLYLY